MSSEIRGPINSIAKVNSSTFITGSQDCTFREWTVNEELYQSEIHVVEKIKLAIKVIALDEHSKILAVGLENGNIDISQR